MRNQARQHCFWPMAIALLSAGQTATADLRSAHFFPWEKEVVANTTVGAPEYSTYEEYFSFANASSGSIQPLNGSCKVFPGDSTWPSQNLWQFFQNKVGGRLIKTVPLAHDCYNTVWGEYNAAQCAYVSSNWNVSYLQSVIPLSDGKLQMNSSVSAPTTQLPLPGPYSKAAHAYPTATT
ncbi:hypothetical protein MPH_02886 [Macrophomina phaseolina MS6]|uniref:Uncharacterized protein n=1 Tax=Macrophomina phaseolina (strain MS6) TaxID=1126212 RepID=K2S462_MACPH|nr:hypothetical protein MPH_02886 [Macrophomina phaseolina MS6]